MWILSEGAARSLVEGERPEAEVADGGAKEYSIDGLRNPKLGGVRSKEKGRSMLSEAARSRA